MGINAIDSFYLWLFAATSFEIAGIRSN